MPCRTIHDDDGRMVGVACGPGPGKTCRFCRAESKRTRKSTKLCDWKTSSTSTCDAPMCAEHATSVGPARFGVVRAPMDKDLCPPHNARWENIKAKRRERAEA